MNKMRPLFHANQQVRWPAGSTSGVRTSGVRHSNPSIPKTNRLWGWRNGWLEYLLRLPNLVTLGGIARSYFEKAEALADSQETQLQPATDPSVPAVIEMFNVALRSYLPNPVRERKLSISSGSHRVSQGRQDSGPKRYPKQCLKHLPQRSVSIQAKIFKVVLFTHHFPTMWKHAREISVFKPGNDPSLP